MFQTSFARHDPHLHPLDPAPLLLFVPLTIRSTLRPAPDRTTRPACEGRMGGWRATAPGCADGRRRALIGLGADRWPWTETLLGSVSHSPGLRWGPCA